MNKTLEDIIHKLFYTCEEATYQIEKKTSTQAIDTISKIRLKGHLAMCKWCNAYNIKVTIIDNAMIRIAKNYSHNIDNVDEQELKTKLKEHLYDNL